MQRSLPDTADGAKIQLIGFARCLSLMLLLLHTKIPCLSSSGNGERGGVDEKIILDRTRGRVSHKQVPATCVEVKRTGISAGTPTKRVAPISKCRKLFSTVESSHKFKRWKSSAVNLDRLMRIVFGTRNADWEITARRGGE